MSDDVDTATPQGVPEVPLLATTELADHERGVADGPKVKQGLKAALAYTVASGLSNLLSFLLLPIMTRIISPAQYGQLSIALAIGGVISIVLTLGLDVSALRNYYQLADDPRRREGHIGLLWLVLLIVPLTAVAIMSAVIAPLLANSSVLPPVNFVLALFGGALLAAATTIPFAVLRAAQRLRAFLVIGIGNAVLSSAGAVVAVVILRTGVTGWLASAVIAGGPSALTLALMRIP